MLTAENRINIRSLRRIQAQNLQSCSSKSLPIPVNSNPNLGVPWVNKLGVTLVSPLSLITNIQSSSKLCSHIPVILPRIATSTSITLVQATIISHLDFW